MNKKLKIFIFLIVILAIGAFVFSSFSKTPSSPKSINPISSNANVIPLPGNGNSTQQKSADEFSAILSTVKSISIDTSLFETSLWHLELML
jgi:hypothetical protein